MLLKNDENIITFVVIAFLLGSESFYDQFMQKKEI